MADQPLIPLLEDILPLVALGIFWVWGASPLLNFIVSRQLRRQADREAHVQDTISLSDAGFAPSTQWAEPVPWSFVERVVETERLLLIYHGYSKDPFYIPTYRLSGEDRERIRAVLERHLQSRPTSMQLLRAT